MVSSLDGVEPGCYQVGMHGKQLSIETPPKFTSFGRGTRSRRIGRDAEGMLH